MFNEPNAEPIYTVGQVARLCRVSCRTVHKWYDSGKLQGYRLPVTGKGGNQRRIPRGQLLSFLEQQGMSRYLAEAGRILLLGTESILTQTLLKQFSHCWQAEDWFSGGRLFAQHQPDLIVIDFSMGAFTSSYTGNQLKRQSPELCLIGILNEDDLQDVSGFDHWYRKPINPEQLIEVIHDHQRCDHPALAS